VPRGLDPPFDAKRVYPGVLDLVFPQKVVPHEALDSATEQHVPSKEKKKKKYNSISRRGPERRGNGSETVI
jgi:hypothetical protein